MTKRNGQQRAWLALGALSIFAVSGCGGGSGGPSGGGGDNGGNENVDANRIVFLSLRDGNREIYSMLPDGSNQQRLTTNSAQEIDPSRPRSAEFVVFGSDRDGNFEIYKSSIDGSAVQQLTNDQDEPKPLDLYPAVSPNGQHIVWASSRGTSNSNQPEFSVYLMDSTGANQRPLPINDFGGFLSWTPDSSAIVYTANDDNETVLRTHNITTNAETELTRRTGSIYDAAISPDGETLAYTVGTEPQLSIVLRDLDTGNERPGPTANSSNSMPTWSLNGRFLFFASSAGSNTPSQIYRVDTSSPNAAPIQLTTEGDNFAPFLAG